jgi:nitric oxide dioxygenase
MSLDFCLPNVRNIFISLFATEASRNNGNSDRHDSHNKSNNKQSSTMTDLTQEEIQIIASTVPVLQQYGNKITTVFYANLLHDVPALRSVFSQTHQATGHQATALANALYAYASNIDNLSALAPALELICNKHASLYVQPEQYDVVGTYLLAAMQEVLGDALTPEVKAAWGKAYGLLAGLMIEKEKELYADAKQHDWTDWKQMSIAKKVQETEQITSFYLEPVDVGKTASKPKLPSYKPGQYVSVRVHIDQLGVKQPRQYSLSDAPGNTYFRISVKREPGVPALEKDPKGALSHPGCVSNLLHDKYEVGDMVEVSHPMGDFFFEEKEGRASGGKGLMGKCPFHQNEIANGNIADTNGHAVHAAANGMEKEANGEPSATPAPLMLIGAGVGITPLMSILRSQLSRPSSSATSQRYITLLHGAATSALRPFTADLQFLRKTHPNLKTIFFNSNSGGAPSGFEHDCFSGRLDLDKVQDVLKERGLGDGNTQYFVCGPESFMKDVEKKLVNDFGIDAKKVHLELFSTGGVPRV